MQLNARAQQCDMSLEGIQGGCTEDARAMSLEGGTIIDRAACACITSVLALNVRIVKLQICVSHWRLMLRSGTAPATKYCLKSFVTGQGFSTSL